MVILEDIVMVQCFGHLMLLFLVLLFCIHDKVTSWFLIIAGGELLCDVISVFRSIEFCNVNAENEY